MTPEQEEHFLRTLEASAADNDEPDDPEPTEPATAEVPVDDLALAEAALKRADEFTDQVRQAA